MTNPNKCKTCDYHSMNTDPQLHCYMFKHAPAEVCMQHSVRLEATRGIQSLGKLIRSSLGENK